MRYYLLEYIYIFLSLTDLKLNSFLERKSIAHIVTQNLTKLRIVGAVTGLNNQIEIIINYLQKVIVSVSNFICIVNESIALLLYNCIIVQLQSQMP